MKEVGDKVLKFFKKGGKVHPMVDKSSVGKITLENEEGEEVGKFDFRASADADKLRQAKTIRIKSDIGGVKDEKEVSM